MTQVQVKETGKVAKAKAVKVLKEPKNVRIFDKGFDRVRSLDTRMNGKLAQAYVMPENPDVRIYKVRERLLEEGTGNKLGIRYTITVAKNGNRPAQFQMSVTSDESNARQIEAKVRQLANSRNRK